MAIRSSRKQGKVKFSKVICGWLITPSKKSPANQKKRGNDYESKEEI